MELQKSKHLGWTSLSASFKSLPSCKILRLVFFFFFYKRTGTSHVYTDLSIQVNEVLQAAVPNNERGQEHLVYSYKRC